MRAGECSAISCRAAILDTEVFCTRHRALIESDVRRVLERTFRPGRRRQSQVFEIALQTAIAQVLNEQTGWPRSVRSQEEFEF